MDSAVSVSTSSGIPKELARYRAAPYMWSSHLWVCIVGRCCICARNSFKLIGLLRHERIGAKVAFGVVSSRISFSRRSIFR